MDENKALDTNSLEGADALSFSSGTPEESEKGEEFYRTFKTQEDFQACIDRALGKRLSKARQDSEELESTKTALSELFERYKVASVSELSEILKGQEGVQTENTEVISAEELEKELRFLSQNESSIYGIGQAESLLADGRFKALLQNGFSVKEAFDALHIPELLSAQVREQEQNILRNIRLRGLRPDEAALSGYGSFSHGLDPKNLTQAQREDIRERVRRGERITF